MIYLELQNPTDKLLYATINMDGGLCLKFKQCSSSKVDNFKSIVGAKRYFAANYQSKKYGHPKPIWKEIEFPETTKDV